MKIITTLLFFLTFNFIAITDVLCQRSGCVKNKIIIKSYQISGAPLAEIDSVLSKSQPFKIEVDSFSNNKKISTAMLEGERVTGRKFYFYNLKGNLLKTVAGSDSTVYTYDNMGRIRSVTVYDGWDDGDIYSARYKYKNGKTYLTDYNNSIPAVTTVFWRSKNKRSQYSRVLTAKSDYDYYLKKYDEHGEVVSEEECLNNKCTVVLNYILEYNKCGMMTKMLLLYGDQKVYSAITYDI